MAEGTARTESESEIRPGTPRLLGYARSKNVDVSVDVSIGGSVGRIGFARLLRRDERRVGGLSSASVLFRNLK